MPRLVEIVFFLVPFAGFVAWRLWFPSPLPPPWLTYGLAGCVALMLMALAWAWYSDAGDANMHYIPASLQDGRVVTGHSAASP